MRIIGCDLHTRYQNVAMVDTEMGQIVERRLEHENREARKFYASLPGPAGDARNCSISWMPRSGNWTRQWRKKLRLLPKPPC